MQPGFGILIVASALCIAALPPGRGADLAGIDRPQPGRAMRASSADPDWRNGNWDARGIPPGETLTIAELEGPGRIRHIWFTIAAGDPFYPRTTVLRIYWDGREEPAVESPLGDFFAVGHGLRRMVDSIPVAVSSDGRAYNCYWPMPFAESARITVSNDSDRPVQALFWYVDWVKLDGLPPETPYFHAQYRQEFPCASGEDYLILDAEGRGHYVGTVLSVRMNEKSWFGEGDDRFYIDGETEPSLRGTGTEDYFCDAWGFREFMRPWYGVTLWEGFEVGDRGTVYRWHVPDPVPFEKSLRVTIEHKGAGKAEDGKWSGFVERADDFSSVAFWYQTGTAKRFAEIPPAAERLPERIVIEAEDLLDRAVVVPEGVIQLQPGGLWSGEGQVFLTSQDPETELLLPFEVEETGDYVLRIGMTRSFDYGTYAIYLDGEPVGPPRDFYNPTVTTGDVKLGLRRLEAGTHTLAFVCAGANERSRITGTNNPGYYLGVDTITLFPTDR